MELEGNPFWARKIILAFALRFQFKWWVPLSPEYWLARKIVMERMCVAGGCVCICVCAGVLYRPKCYLTEDARLGIGGRGVDGWRWFSFAYAWQIRIWHWHKM